MGVSEAYAIDAGTCGALMVTYSIVRYVSWGKASLAIQKTWNDPHLSWGSLPAHLQKVWDTPQVNCNAQLQNPPLLKK